MRCDDFRRKLLEDPRRGEAEFLAHRASCRACEREAARLERLESELGKLLKVAPPPDLAQRLRPARRRGWLPLVAASLAGVLGLGVWWWQVSLRAGTDGIIVAVMDHIEREPEAFASRVTLGPGDYRDLSPGVSLETDGWVRAVSYAAPCDILDGPGLHLVLQGAGGPVTVLVITGERVPRQELIHADGMHGVLRPLARGSLAVVGRAGSGVEVIAAEIAARIRIHV